MKEYPSILHAHERTGEVLGQHCFAAYKCDGSCIRVEYSRKTGFSKFGSRTRLLDKSDLILGSAIDIFMNDFSEPLEKIIKDNREYREQGEALFCLEFFGPSSFAGTHVQDEPKQLVLFDVNIHRKGFLGPKEFRDKFGNLKIAELIYEGKLTKDFIEDVKQGKYPVDEGVIVSGGNGHKRWQRKIKTNQYLEKLKGRFNSEWEKYL